MGKTNNSFRIRTDVGTDKFVTVNLDSEYDTLEILSLKINQRGQYRYHTSGYGVVVGRVLANNGFGVPNAKLSLFIAKDENATIIENAIYPYTTVGSKNNDGIRYNLLPSNQKDDCHQVVGTFPSKRMMLDDGGMLEVFDKYYLYTTRTNESGDYMFFGVPVGTYNLHMDLDISDCGKLSQRPRDFVYKGYNIDQFENPNQFKIDTELSTLPQIFSQDTTIEVKPFWGDENEGTNIGITREDINVNYRFEPTCVFMGSIVSDTPNDGINKRCVPTNKMGDMRELVTGSGTIEIIRKKIDNTIEELQIKGKQLINGNGVWCFQIPMNLDYVMTDEYGNLVPTDNPERGIPTRCEVRFRLSLDGTQSENDMYKRGKVLVPHNPLESGVLDYEFGSKTLDESFKSLMWNGVYTIKSFIPRFQKARNIKTNKFTGIKNVNIHGGNNPMPYNNIRIKIPFMFWLLCNIVKAFIWVVKTINVLKVALMSAALNLVNLPYTYISNEFCPDLEYWYFAPGMNTAPPSNTLLRKFWKWITGGKGGNGCSKWQHESACLTFKSIADDIKASDSETIEVVTFYQYMGKNTGKAEVLTEEEWYGIVGTGKTAVSYDKVTESTTFTDDYATATSWVKMENKISTNVPTDKYSTEVKNALNDIDPRIKLTPDTSYLKQCVEMNLAQEYEVIKFDFYNDWVNGVVYLPRWARDVKFKRRRRNGKKVIEEKVKGCINDIKRSRISRRYVQQCSLSYNGDMTVKTDIGCRNNDKLRCHKKDGMGEVTIFGGNSGVVQEQKTILGDNVYYMKPIEGDNVLLFATDIVMLGTLFDCDENGLPSTFDSLTSTTYKMPTNMAMTNVDDDSYSYVGGDGFVDDDGIANEAAPKVSTVNSWKCGSNCVLEYIAEDGVRAIIPTYEEIQKMMDEYEGIKDDDAALPYEDIFPVTEMAGIEWGYTGPDQGAPSNDRMYAPGGHFMGLACGNAETNIRSCVNLKRACEIGTTLSERFDVPIGYKDMDDDSKFDIANYLYISPNGLIAKDQINDVTFRSAFATMNQNNLATEVDAVSKHKKYKFSYLIPDSFDGSLSNKLPNQFNSRIQLEWDNYWTTAAAENNETYQEIWQKNAVLEEGYTINRVFETRSDDYIKFRHYHKDNKPVFLKNDSMPVYRNSFYFYFGLKNGLTALDEFKSQFFAPCAKALLVGNESDVVYDIQRHEGEYFKYDIGIEVKYMVAPYSYVLTKTADSFQSSENMSPITKTDESNTYFEIENVSIGKYVFKITDSKGIEVVKELEVGTKDISVDYDKNRLQHYEQKITNDTFDYYEQTTTNGGKLDGTFNVIVKDDADETEYNIRIVRVSNSEEIIKGDNRWNKMFDGTCNQLRLWGYGEYYVYVYVANDTAQEYLYDIFTVNDGVAPPSVMVGTIPYTDETFYDLNSLQDVQDKANYELYKILVSPETIGADFKKQINLSFSVNDATYKFDNIFVGRGEKTDGENFGLSANVDFRTNFGNVYNLNFNSIIIPSDYPENDKRGKFYYTAYNRVNDVYATDSKDAVYTDNGVTITGCSNWDYGVLHVNGVKHLLPVVDGTITIDTPNDYNLNNGDSIRVGRLVGVPVFRNPFSYEAITLLTPTSNSYVASKSKENDGTVQCYQDTLQFELNENKLRIKEVNGVEVNIGESFDDYNKCDGSLDELQMTYSHYYSNSATDRIEYKLSNIKDGVVKNDAYQYYFVDADMSDELVFDADGYYNSNKIVNGKLTWTEDNVTTDTMMEKRAENGETYAIFSDWLSSVVTGNTYWGFWRYKENVGDDADNRNYRNSKKLNVIKPSSTIKFVEKTKFLTDATLVHTYDGDNATKYVLYEWKNNKIQKYSSTPEDISKVEIKNSTSSKIVEIKPSDNNGYRYGSIFRKQIFEGGEATSTIVPNIPLQCGFETVYTEEENNVDIIFSFGDIQFTVITKTTAKNLNYRLVLCAKNGDNIIASSLYNNNSATLSVTWEDLKKITKFEFILVENYDNNEGGMSNGNNEDAPPQEEKRNVTVKITAIVIDDICSKVKFNVSGLGENALSVKLIYDGIAYYNGYLTSGETTEVLNSGIEGYDNSKLTYLVSYGSEYYNVSFTKMEPDITSTPTSTPSGGMENENPENGGENGEEGETPENPENPETPENPEVNS